MDENLSEECRNRVDSQQMEILIWRLRRVEGVHKVTGNAGSIALVSFLLEEGGTPFETMNKTARIMALSGYTQITIEYDPSTSKVILTGRSRERRVLRDAMS